MTYDNDRLFRCAYNIMRNMFASRLMMCAERVAVGEMKDDVGKACIEIFPREAMRLRDLKTGGGR